MPSLGLPIFGQSPAGAAAGDALAQPRRARRQRRAGRRAVYPDGEQPAPEGFSRRSFLQVLGASTALAGLSACKPPREQVVSYVSARPGVTPSVAAHYATAVSRGGYARRASSSRATRGAPPRSRATPTTRPAWAAPASTSWPPSSTSTTPTGWPASAAHGQRGGLERLPRRALGAGRRPRQGRRRPAARPGRADQLADAGRPAGQAAGPLPPGAHRRLGPGRRRRRPRGRPLAFGRPLDVELRLVGADVILSLDSDFLATEGDHLRHARDFASRRGQPSGMNRLYVAEGGFTVTGGAADHRLRMRASEVLGFGRAVAAALAADHGLAQLASLGAPLTGDRGRQAVAVAADLAQVPRPRRGAGRAAAARRGPRPGRGASTRRSATPGPPWSTASRRCSTRPAARTGSSCWRRSCAPARSTRWSSPPGTRSTPRQPTSISWRCSPRSPTSSTSPRATTRRPRSPAWWWRPPIRSRAGATCEAATARRRSSSRSSPRWSSASPSSTCWPPSSTWATWAPGGWCARAGGPAPPTRALRPRLRRGRWRSRASDAGFDRAWSEWLAAGVVSGRAAASAAPVKVAARPGPRGRRAAGGAAGPAPGSRPASPPTTRRSTAATPRTPGCRSCRTRSPSSPGTTPPASRRPPRPGSASRPAAW